MKQEEIQILFTNFEDAVCKVNDTECWPNGELDATMLGPDGEKIQIEQIF